VGYGAGNKEVPNMPNVLRIVIGELIDVWASRRQNYSFKNKTDNTTCKIVGYTVNKLLQEFLNT
jgi:uncharacterized protein (DUF111 family)